MPKAEFYPPELAKSDPLTTIHIKVPMSIIPVFGREGRFRQRHASWLMRESLVVEAAKLKRRHEAEDEHAKPVVKKRA